MDNEYTLDSEPNFVLKRICEKKQLDPIEALTQSIAAARSHVPLKIKKPPLKWIKMKGLVHKAECARSMTRVGSYKQGMNDMAEELIRINTVEHFAEVEAEAKIGQPYDLSIRQLSYFAKLTDRNFTGLLKSINNGLSPEKPNNWRTKLAIEKIEHDETKAELEQAKDELIIAKRRTFQLIEILNENGIQDIEIQD